AFVYHGSATGISPTANGSLRKEPGAPPVGTTWHASRFGAWVASAGDVNADGFSDVVVVAPDPAPTGDATPFVGTAFVFLGGTGGVPTTAPDTSTAHANAIGASAVTNRVHVSQYAGDIDGDGYGDLVSGAPTWGGTGALLMNRGSSTGAPSVTWLLGGGGAGFGTTIAAVLWGCRVPPAG